MQRLCIIAALSVLPALAIADAPKLVNPATLEPLRTAGQKIIAPSDAAKKELGATHAVGTFKLCLDATGTPSSVDVVETTKSKTYDGEIVVGVKAWRYKPYQENGVAVPVCTAVTFVYTAN